MTETPETVSRLQESIVADDTTNSTPNSRLQNSHLQSQEALTHNRLPV